MSEPVAIWRSNLLSDVAHGFAGRRGGVSSGDSASLNTGSMTADDAALVDENRRRAANAVLPGAALIGVRQVHGAACVTLTEAAATPIDADAMVTDRPGLLLGVLTADCAPVLLADASAGVVGAAHAGWRGALAGVTDGCVAAMTALGADAGRIVAAVGPCIARTSYEVDAGLLRAFVEDDADNERFFIEGRGNRWQFDLEAYVAARLAAAGVTRVELMGLDTYAREDDFFSHRRATHRGEAACGRQLAMIGVAT